MEKFIKSFTIALIVILSIWIGNFFLMNHFFNKPNEVGDSYGALNTLFSGFAFAGIILSIFMQSKELKLQRDEIKDNRLELSRQADALERQANNLKISAKLSSLNSLLTYYQGLHRVSLNNPRQQDIYKREMLSIVNEIKRINEIKDV